MRATDLAHLNEPYPEEVDPTDADAMAAIGVKLPHWTFLQNQILADFTEQAPYGIGWWAPNPGVSRRILISDQFYCCLASVASNMTEAALHWLEYLDASERDSARFADAVKMQRGGPTLSPPRVRSPYDQLSPDFMRVHQAGIIRALASTLDCLAGVLIGVVAVPQSILRADFAGARRALGKINDSGAIGLAAQAQFAARLETAIAAAGPPGWLDWTLDFRNMLVHRGRRIELGQYLPVEPVLHGPDGHPVIRSRRVSHLPRDPARSDIEVFLDMPCNLVLHEEAQRTLQGLISSTSNLLETAATDLLEFWRWRRAHPVDLPQPAAQWPHGPSTLSAGFSGYAPGSLSLNSETAMLLHPITARRFHAAALDDRTRQLWTTFD
jgi:hypothetical protein